MTTAIRKWGNSHGVRISKKVLESVRWKDNEQVILKAMDGKIIIEKANRRKNIKELFDEYNEEYTPANIDWGEPEGEEIW